MGANVVTGVLAQMLSYKIAAATTVTMLTLNTSGTHRAAWSNDGITWTAADMSSQDLWEYAAWSSTLNLWAACGANNAGTAGVLATSPDAITWTARTPGGATVALSYVAMIWNGSKFLCLSPDDAHNVAQQSTDGITWTESSTGGANTWRGLAWSPALSLFAAVSNDGSFRVMTSPDGTTWTNRSASEVNQWWDVCWAPSLAIFCAVARDGTHRVMTSSDGTTWTNRTAAAANFWRKICWSPDLSLFCAVSSDNPSALGQVMTSPDGTNWTSRAASSASAWIGVVWSTGLQKFIATASGSQNTMTSPDGTTWTNHSTALPTSENWFPVATNG